jgi:hypothetical protein
MKILKQESGVVTAEFVLTIPAVIALLGALVLGFRVGIEQQELQAFAWRESRALAMPNTSHSVVVPQNSSWRIREYNFADRVCLSVTSQTWQGLEAYQCAPVYVP